MPNIGGASSSKIRLPANVSFIILPNKEERGSILPNKEERGRNSESAHRTLNWEVGFVPVGMLHQEKEENLRRQRYLQTRRLF